MFYVTKLKEKNAWKNFVGHEHTTTTTDADPSFAKPVVTSACGK
ncbi:hypothetical protein AtNW77_Chr3g0191251 [Arabidopsis thaliana]